MDVRTKTTKKRKKFSFVLPEREDELLTLYAKEHAISRPEAARRIMRDYLRQYRATLPQNEPDNQLKLFDSLQMDIFNSTSKTKDK